MESQGNSILFYCSEFSEESRIMNLFNSRGYRVFNADTISGLLKALCLKDYDLAVFSLDSEQEQITDLSVTVRSLCKVPVIYILGAGEKIIFPERTKNCFDDFVTCPVSEEELIFRVEKIISCSTPRKSKRDDGIFRIGNMSFDPGNRILYTPGGTHSMTGIESKLLYLLCLHGNNVLSRELALEAIWGEKDYFKARSMDVYVSRLRKLLRSDKTVTLGNIHNVGFRLNIEDSSNGKKRKRNTGSEDR